MLTCFNPTDAADDDAEFALHTMLTTPRLPPTPYDPPDYQPIVDKNRILRSYRKLRDAYLKECDRHTRTHKDIIEHKKKIEACKKLGKERMKKQEVRRDKGTTLNIDRDNGVAAAAAEEHRRCLQFSLTQPFPCFASPVTRRRRCERGRTV